ncbi:integrin beta pat-3 [Amyelois transitella]|uniref:integrin beta pat-3 n=1 Tax=Amyelois transitella TaxID=680683 RepID=UPI00298FFAF5|nr:integrin beta pat-3 [Amyelois transitella]
MCSTLYFVLLFFISLTVSEDPCESRDTCSKCITYPNCVWCAKVDYQGSRCKSSNSDIQKQCSEHLQDLHSEVTITRNDNFTSKWESVVQIAPQNIKVKLRVGEPTNFSFKYKQAENYPVDLYFLLDVSKSMAKIRDLLMKQSQDLYNVMQSFTNIIRLGIGTFVDKNTFPFVNNPQKKECYSFRNKLSLTDNVKLFNETLKRTKFIENVDMPEGGLDALGQVLACSNGTNNIIGWSPHSRKIVLFITDDQYHAAGDGLIAGIHQPYDGKCYTGFDGIYKKELEMDYPSVLMIKKLAKKIGAIIIFVAKDSIASIYNNLADAVNGKAEEYSVHETENKQNTKFDKMLKTIYEEKTKTINLLTANVEKNGDLDYDIAFTPDCRKKDIYSESDAACTVKFYEEKLINATITLNKHIDTAKNFSVEILIDGLNEKLIVDVDVITNCDCEATIKIKADQCNRNGALECGLCKCDNNWFGPQCNCTQDYDKTDESTSCKRKGEDIVCSGNGDCICGACECHSHGSYQKYSGKYCQCNADSCPRRNNTICSNHGSCNCGICTCDKLWTGKACEISLLKTNCVKDNKECSGRGKCFNNACVCDVLPEWDERKNTINSICAIIPDTNIHKRQCKTLEEWVICSYNGEDSCTTIEGVKINKIPEITNSDKISWNICDDIRIAVGCYIHFGYKYHDENKTIELLIEEKENCQETYYMFGGLVFATLIFGGIGTLVGWKVLTTIRDRREYEQFMTSSNQRQSSIRNNVLYKSPKVTINNPAYVEHKDDFDETT